MDQTMELAHRVEVARAVAADHDPNVIDALGLYRCGPG